MNTHLIKINVSGKCEKNQFVRSCNATASRASDHFYSCCNFRTVAATGDFPKKGGKYSIVTYTDIYKFWVRFHLSDTFNIIEKSRRVVLDFFEFWSQMFANLERFRSFRKTRRIVPVHNQIRLLAERESTMSPGRKQRALGNS